MSAQSNSKLKHSSFFNREIRIKNCLKKNYFPSLSKNKKEYSNQEPFIQDKTYIKLTTEEIIPYHTIPESLYNQINNYLSSNKDSSLIGVILQTGNKGGFNSSLEYELSYITDNPQDQRGIYHNNSFNFKSDYLYNNMIMSNKNDNSHMTKQIVLNFVDNLLDEFYKKINIYRGKVNISHSRVNLQNGYFELNESIKAEEKKKIPYGKIETNLEKEIDFCDIDSFSNINLNKPQEKVSFDYLKLINSFTQFAYIFTENKVFFTTIYPNIIFEMNILNKISIVSSDLSLFLAGKSSNFEEKIMKNILSGLLTLDQQLRIVTLAYNDQSIKEQIQGIWIKLPLSDKNAKLNDSQVYDLISEYKIIIIERCVNFLLRSDLEEVNSPSPKNNSFYLLLFIYNRPYFLEVKSVNDGEYDNKWVACINNKEKVTVKKLSQHMNNFLNFNLNDDLNQQSFKVKDSLRDSSTFSNIFDEESINSKLKNNNMPLKFSNKKSLVLANAKNINNNIQDSLVFSQKDIKDNKSILSSSSNSTLTNKLGNNVLEIIFDQAKNIKHLQEQVDILKNELQKFKSTAVSSNTIDLNMKKEVSQKCQCGGSGLSTNISCCKISQNYSSNDKPNNNYNKKNKINELNSKGHNTYSSYKDPPKDSKEIKNKNDFSIQVPKIYNNDDNSYEQDGLDSLMDDTIY